MPRPAGLVDQSPTLPRGLICSTLLSMIFAILPIGEPTANNRVYTRECIEQALEKLKEKWLPVVLNVPDSDTPDLSSLIGQVRDLKIERRGAPDSRFINGREIESELVLTGAIIIDESSEEMKQLLAGKIAVRPFGTGCTSGKSALSRFGPEYLATLGQPDSGADVVLDYVIQGVALTDDPA